MISRTLQSKRFIMIRTLQSKRFVMILRTLQSKRFIMIRTLQSKRFVMILRTLQSKRLAQSQDWRNARHLSQRYVSYLPFYTFYNISDSLNFFNWFFDGNLKRHYAMNGGERFKNEIQNVLVAAKKPFPLSARKKAFHSIFKNLIAWLLST